MSELAIFPLTMNLDPEMSAISECYKRVKEHRSANRSRESVGSLEVKCSSAMQERSRLSVRNDNVAEINSNVDIWFDPGKNAHGKRPWSHLVSTMCEIRNDRSAGRAKSAAISRGIAGPGLKLGVDEADILRSRLRGRRRGVGTTSAGSDHDEIRVFKGNAC